MSAYATTDDVLALAPELASVDAVQLALIVETITLELLSASQWGSKLLEGHRTLAAHWAIVQLLGKEALGAVTSLRVDKSQVSYSTSPFSDAELSQTKYGRLHLALRATLANSTVWGEPARGWDRDDGKVPL